MARHAFAARSLRHLRFARRMMVGQPLLARASEGMHAGQASVYIAPDGRQLPLGHVLRRLPRHEASWEAAVAADAFPARAASDAPVAPVSETALRLLPSLSAPDVSDTAPDAAPAVETPPAATRVAAPGRRTVDAAPESSSVSPMPAPAEPAASQPPRPDGRRPRSRIVELPGVIVQPIVEESDESDGEVTDAVAHEIEAEVAAEIPADAQTGDQPLRPDELARDESAPVASTVTDLLAPASAPRRRGAKRGANSPQAPRASDALFPPTEADRSPQTWRARLQQQGTAAPAKPTTQPPTPTHSPDDEPPARGQRPGVRGASRGGQPARAGANPAQGRQAPVSSRPNNPLDAPATSDAVERPSQLPVSSRALLREATGVDPASVRIYRGVEAARLTAAQNSDALTDGETIALGAGHATDAPETLGLLAHELTHVAQRRAPRFVPPAALNTPARRQPPATSATAAPDQPQSRPEAQPATSSSDEEEQAALVEARVTRVARAQQAVSLTAPVVAPERVEPPGRPEQMSRRKQPTQPAARHIWGDLPAPWEPLPDWLTEASDAADSAESPPAFQSAPAAPVTPPAVSAPGRAPSAAASAPTPGVQRAERGRALPAAESEAAPAHEGAAPEPDLDALAQQVHAILKRRLAAERRRFG